MSNFKLFCGSHFPFLYVPESFLKKLLKQCNWFLSNFKLFYDSDFPFLYISENLLKYLENTKIVFKTNSSNFIQFFIYFFLYIKTNKNIFYKFFSLYKSSNIDLFVYIKMVNKYHQKHKENLLKEAHERYQNLSEKEKEKSVSIIVNVIRIFLKK